VGKACRMRGRRGAMHTGFWWESQK
jgi:hypothetical protein